MDRAAECQQPRRLWVRLVLCLVDEGLHQFKIARPVRKGLAVDCE
jgi:hypothetical protein